MKTSRARIVGVESRISRRNFAKLASIAGCAAIGSAFLGGCQGGRSGTASSSGSSAADEPSSGAVAAESSSSSASSSAGASSASAEGGSVLIAYFSWSGNTKEMADRIHEDIPGSTLFRIEPKTAYSNDYDTVVDLAQEELDDNYVPPLKSDVYDFDKYDTIFIGYPLWWYHIPQVVKGFLEAHDFTGKTVIPFETHGGGGWSQSLDDVEECTKGATMLDGLELSGSSVTAHLSEVDEWVEALKL